MTNEQKIGAAIVLYIFPAIAVAHDFTVVLTFLGIWLFVVATCAILIGKGYRGLLITYVIVTAVVVMFALQVIDSVFPPIGNVMSTNSFGFVLATIYLVFPVAYFVYINKFKKVKNE